MSLEAGIHTSALEQFEQLLIAEVPALRRYARALTGNVDAADDLVQDCVERALRKRRLWRPHGRLRSWLMRMLYRLYLNRRKRFATEVAHASRQGETEPQIDRQQPDMRQELRDIMAALSELPDPQRAAIVLVALEDVDYQEAAWILGIPIGTLRSRLSRGREALRRQTGVGVDVPRLRSVK